MYDLLGRVAHDAASQVAADPPSGRHLFEGGIRRRPQCDVVTSRPYVATAYATSHPAEGALATAFGTWHAVASPRA